MYHGAYIFGPQGNQCLFYPVSAAGTGKAQRLFLQYGERNILEDVRQKIFRQLSLTELLGDRLHVFYSVGQGVDELFIGRRKGLDEKSSGCRDFPSGFHKDTEAHCRGDLFRFGEVVGEIGCYLSRIEVYDPHVGFFELQILCHGKVSLCTQGA